MFKVGEVAWYRGKGGHMLPGEIMIIHFPTSKQKHRTYGINPIDDEIDPHQFTANEGSLTKHEQISERHVDQLDRRLVCRVKKVQNKFLYEEKKNREKATIPPRQPTPRVVVEEPPPPPAPEPVPTVTQAQEAALFTKEHRGIAIKRLTRVIQVAKNISRKEARTEALNFEKNLVDSGLRFGEYWQSMKRHIAELLENRCQRKSQMQQALVWPPWQKTPRLFKK